jgi:hypothetical protein
MNGMAELSFTLAAICYGLAAITGGFSAGFGCVALCRAIQRITSEVPRP